ncbi:MAG TPA: hypothetical protein VFG03_12135 [Telluria sp.]|nr:hypothetical protein [Telluria sp.]
MQTTLAPLFDVDQAAFMQRGISLNVGSCGTDLQPSVARAVGCRISADRRTVRLLVSARQAAAVIAHLEQGGALAAVFSEPSTHRTVQLKGQGAAVEAPVPGDLATVARYRDGLVEELRPLGFAPALVRALLACPDSDIVALCFTPCAAFSQTPGADAGRALKAGA